MTNAATSLVAPRPETPRREKYTPASRSFIHSEIDSKLFHFLMTLEDLSMERTPDLTTRWGIVYDADLRPTFGSDDTIGRLWAKAEAGDDPYLKTA